MNEMRIVLLVIGAVLLLLIYLIGRRQSRRAAENMSQSRARMEPHTSFEEEGFGANDVGSVDGADLTQELEGLDRLISEDEPAPSNVTEASIHRHKKTEVAASACEKLLVLHIVPKGDEPFHGLHVRQVLEDQGLVFGDMGIYHRMLPHEEGEDSRALSVFSVASISEPGTFDPDTQDDTPLQGLTFFLQLPGPAVGISAFDDMVSTAQRMVMSLDGCLWDRTRLVLNGEMIQHLRDDIQGFERQQHFLKRA